MRAARMTGVGKPVEIHEVPVPAPGPGEVLVRVAACGVCASDVHVLDGSLPAMPPLPVTMGHEPSGTVEAAGEGVLWPAPGDRVVMHAGKRCGACRPCRAGHGLEECLFVRTMGVDFDGAWADYVVVPASSCVALPKSIPFDQGAILADAVATPYAAVVETGQVRPGDRVAIFGVGGLGTHAVQIARLCGASFVAAVDPRQSARSRATALGADIAVDPDGAVGAIRDATGGEGVDAAFDFVGANAVVKACVSSLARGGRAVIVGVGGEKISLGPSILFALKHSQLRGAYGYRRTHIETLVSLVASGRLDLSASITANMPLEQAADAVEILATKRGDPVRIILSP
ncbi:MAG TPA: zinc-binding dehydrogenase [Actinomycetota bacterium]|nr:zinc-binding dehydrogenase [Actinomycetota bacterium]